jgi:class 3 adenylate cyclase
MSKQRIAFFLLVFGLLNLSFIPLMSLYGLRVCPVLSIPGFGFGCYYAGLYIGLILLLNAAMVLAITFCNHSNRVLKPLVTHLGLTMAATYFVSSGIALMLLQALLHLNHLTTRSRGPEILAFASLLLGITQSYGLIWALHGSSIWKNPSVGSFRSSWIIHVGRTTFPILIAGGILLHFLIAQSVSFNAGLTAPLVSNDEIILQTSYLIYFLMTWLGVTYSFHFLSERDQVKTVQKHLSALDASTDAKYRSLTADTWGLWKPIVHHLNLFSQTLEERGRLLNAFSKFVTDGVAKDVLKEDVTVLSGETREMTVLMIDIRNFTSMSETLDPHQVVELLNEYFASMLAVILKLRVTVDKFIGDGILAYVESIDSAEATDEENRIAVEAALQMLNSVQGLNEKLRSRSLPEISIGVGIYRGSLVIGLIGTQSRMQHTIIGDTVNRTARLESLCKELSVSIVISGPVWNSLEESKRELFKSFGTPAIKGFSEPMEVFGGPVT